MRRTKHLMEVLTLSGGCGAPMRQAKVYSMNALLAPEVELIVPDVPDANGSFDKEEMEAADLPEREAIALWPHCFPLCGCNR